jgi:mannan endo-1,4-beta-mannosidase
MTITLRSTTWLRLLLSAALAVAVWSGGLFSPTPVLAAGENLLANPGFEAGDANWEKWGSPIVTSGAAHSGTKSLMVKRNTGGASMSVAVQPGKTYRVGLWVKFAAAGVSSHTLTMDSFGTQQGQQNLTFSGSTEWEYKQLLYTPLQGVQHIRISFWNSTAADYYMDDAVIRENVDTENPTTPGQWQAEHRPDSLKLRWEGSTDDMGVASYELAYKKVTDPQWTTLLVPHTTGQNAYTYTLSGLDSYTVYAIRLLALDGAGNRSEPLLGLEATPGPNLVANPDLESGSVTPWEVWKSLTVTDSNPHSGQYALWIKNLTGGGTKKITAEPNISYLFSYWSRFSAQPGGWFGLDGTFMGPVETRTPILPEPTLTWSYTERTLRSGAADGLLRLSVWNNTGVDMFMDDVFIGKIPELPGSLEPAAPGGLAVISTDGVSANVQWTPPAAPLGITGYKISYKKNSGSQWSELMIPPTSGNPHVFYKLEGLSPETQYDIKVQALSEGTLISAVTAVQAQTTAMLPVNPNASPEAAALLKRLYALTGNSILTGQHNYYEEPERWYDEAAELSGFYPALWGSDFAYYTGGDFAGLRQAMTDTAIAKGQEGVVIALTYHQPRPSDPATAGWESVTADVTEAEMQEIVTPGTVLYSLWEAQMDEVAGYLTQLRDAGVPVLWRPYHEMNAEFFWWGARPELFKQLWINTYQRLAVHHGLNNLIWLWNPNAESAWAYDSAPYYPGHQYVDVLAMDIYNNDYRDSYYNKLVQTSGGRPIAIGENGELPDMDMLAAKQSRYVYFMTWPGYLTDKNSLSQIQAVYAHPRAVNQGPTPNGPYVPPPADSYIIDDFEQYGGSDGSLRSKWQRNTSGNALTVTLSTYGSSSGAYGLKLDYMVGNPGYAGAFRSLGAEWPGMEAIEFWLTPDGSNRQLAVQFHETNGEVWEAGYKLAGTAPVLVRLPFSAFARPGWSTGGNGVIDLGSIKEFAFYIAQGSGSQGSGTLYFDNIRAVKLPVPE